MSTPSYPSAAVAEFAVLADAQVESARAYVETERATAAVVELVRGAEQTIERINASTAALESSFSVSVERAVSMHIAERAIAQEIKIAAYAQNRAIMDFMQSRGLAAEVVTALDAWIRLQAAVAAAERPPTALPSPAQANAVVDRDPFEALSAAQMGERLRLVAASVRLREQSGELFSTLPPGRERGREYPAFQAWPEIAGDPLRQVLQALGQPDGGTAWGFFASTSPELEQLTPVEVLSGQLVRARTINDSAQALLDADVDVRREVVKGAAQAFAADRAA